ncbi:MAG: four helix bundle protein [Candidatus Riflebacteria bacterium]|nr:four helix bundle protein [Candidatus Riflebacteria bacterium]
MKVNSFYDLEVWKLSMDLVEQLYGFLQNLPKEELYVLSDQMRRALISIPSNIAEGQKRYNPKEFKRFLYYSRGSLGELMTQIILCNRLGYLSDDNLERVLNRCELIDRKINNLIHSLPNRELKKRNNKSSVTSNNLNDLNNSNDSNNSNNSN